MKSKYEDKIFDVLLLLITGTAVVMSFSYDPTARAFPLYFGLIPFLFVLLNLIVGSMADPPKALRFIKQKGTLSGLGGKGEEERKPEDEITWKQIMGVVAWLIGYIVALVYVYYLAATFAFLFLFLMVAGKVPWFKTLLISVCFTGLLYVLFEVIL